MKENKEQAEAEIIGAAAQNPESEIGRLTKENDALKLEISYLKQERDNYYRWWGECRDKVADMRNLIKAIVKVADLA